MRETYRSIQRAIHVLTTLAEHPYPLGLLELSEYVNLSRASVHRILMTLVRVGWVEQNPRTTKYRLGMGAVGVGIVGMVTNPLIRDSYPYLTRLSDWSGHDSVLSTLVGGKTVQLRRAAGINTELIDFEAGHPQPAYAMADGKLLLSYLDESEAESLLRSEEMRPFTTSTITDVTTMLRELETIRKQGFAVDNFERFEAGRGLAVPVMGEGDLPVAVDVGPGSAGSGERRRDDPADAVAGAGTLGPTQVSRGASDSGVRGVLRCPASPAAELITVGSSVVRRWSGRCYDSFTWRRLSSATVMKSIHRSPSPRVTCPPPSTSSRKAMSPVQGSVTVPSPLSFSARPLSVTPIWGRGPLCHRPSSNASVP